MNNTTDKKCLKGVVFFHKATFNQFRFPQFEVIFRTELCQIIIMPRIWDKITINKKNSKGAHCWYAGSWNFNQTNCTSYRTQCINNDDLV